MLGSLRIPVSCRCHQQVRLSPGNALNLPVHTQAAICADERQPCPWLGLSSKSVSRAPTKSRSGSWARAVLPAREQLQAEVTLTDRAVSLVTFLSGGSGQESTWLWLLFSRDEEMH